MLYNFLSIFNNHKERLSSDPRHVIPKVTGLVQFIVQFRDQPLAGLWFRRSPRSAHSRCRLRGKQTPVSALPHAIDAPSRTRDVSPRFRNDFLTLRQLPLHLLFHSNPTPFHGPRSTRGWKRAFRAKARTSFTNPPSFLSFFLASCHIRNFPLGFAGLDNWWNGLEWILYFSSILIAILETRSPRAKARQLLLPSSR